MNVKVMKLNPNAVIPKQAHEGDVGLDLATIETKWLFPFQRKLFKTGIAVQPEDGYELQIRPRSGLALKKGLTVLNSPATIEPTYTGDVGVILYNTSFRPIKIVAGARIAQGVFKKYEAFVDTVLVDSLDESVRGSNGFGSTGVK